MDGGDEDASTPGPGSYLKQQIWEPSDVHAELHWTNAAWSNETGKSWMTARLKSEEQAFIAAFVENGMAVPSSPHSSKRPAVRTPRARKQQQNISSAAPTSGTADNAGSASSAAAPSAREERAMMRTALQAEEASRVEALKASAAAMLRASRQKRATSASMRRSHLERMSKSRLAERAALRAVSERREARVDGRKSAVAEKLIKTAAARQARQLEDDLAAITAMACVAARQVSAPTALWGDFLSSMGKEAAAKSARLKAGEQRRQAWIATMESMAVEEAAKAEERAAKAELVTLALSSPEARAALVAQSVKEAAARVAAKAAEEKKARAEEVRQAKAALRQAEAAVKAQVDKVAAEHEFREFDVPAVGARAEVIL